MNRASEKVVFDILSIYIFFDHLEETQSIQSIYEILLPSKLLWATQIIGLTQCWVCVNNLQVDDTVFNAVNSNLGVPLECSKIWAPLFLGQINICVLVPSWAPFPNVTQVSYSARGRYISESVLSIASSRNDKDREHKPSEWNISCQGENC